MSLTTFTPLIAPDYFGSVPDIIKSWKYTKHVEIDNIGCPTQINLLLDQDGFEVAPLLYIRLRGGGCTVRFCPTGEVERGDPLLYSTSCRENTLTTVRAIALFEIVIPLVTMAIKLHQSGVDLLDVLPKEILAVDRFVQGRREKRARDNDNLDEKKDELEEGEIVTQDKVDKRVCVEEVTAN